MTAAAGIAVVLFVLLFMFLLVWKCRNIIERLDRTRPESIPEEVARLCPRPLFMVNASRKIESWIKQWI